MDGRTLALSDVCSSPTAVALSLLGTGRCLRADDVEMLAQPALRGCPVRRGTLVTAVPGVMVTQ